MPHVVIVNCVYPPEPVVSAQMGRDLAAYLVQTGARLTVLCPHPSRPLGADYVALQPSGRPLRRQEDAIEVVRLPSFAAPRSRLLPRMRESWSFGRHVCQYLQHHLPSPDVVYANTWPILSQMLIGRYCASRSVPLVWHIKDLYPESLLTRLPDGLGRMITTPLASLDGWIARQADRTVVLSERLREVYANSRGLGLERVTAITDWIDDQSFAHLPQRTVACGSYQVPEDRFTFLYLGNIGPLAGVELLIESFRAACVPRAQLVIAGDGSAKAACVTLAQKLGVRDVRFISDPDAGNVPLLQSLGHVCLLPMRKGGGQSSVPSKLMAYMLSGKPVLATVDAGSDTARCIRSAKCGWVGEPGNARWLAAKLSELPTISSVVLKRMGERGRDYGLKHFSKSEGVRRLGELVLAVGARRNASVRNRSWRENLGSPPGRRDGGVEPSWRLR